jgi:hypothetical protein
MVNMINNIVKFNQELFTAIRTGFSKPIIVDQFTGLPTLISFMPHLIRALANPGDTARVRNRLQQSGIGINGENSNYRLSEL